MVWGISRKYTDQDLDYFAGQGAYFRCERDVWGSASSIMTMTVRADSKENLLRVIAYIEEHLRLMRKDILKDA